MPYIEARKNGALAMCAAWCVAPAVFCIYMMIADPSHDDAIMIAISLIMSAMFVIIGAVLYLGYAGILAGFNTMSPKELEKYNMAKISSFTGLCFVLLAFVIFFGTLAAQNILGSVAAFVVMFVAVLAVVFAMAILLDGKAFKN